MNTPLTRKSLLILSAFGPGIFLIGYNIGPGSVTTMAKTGAEHGMQLFWVVVLSSLFTYFLMVAYGQLTIITGQTALRSLRRWFSPFHFGTILAMYILIALVLGEFLAITGIMGIVADLLQEGIRIVSGHRVDTFWITTVLAIGIYALLWIGDYAIFEKCLIALVALMGICFLVVFVMVKPNLSVVVKGLVPNIPDIDGSLGLIAAISGTTCSAAVFVIRSTVVAEKNWKIDDLAHEKRDAMVSSILMLALSGIIMAVAAGTLYVMPGSEQKLTNAVDLIRLFEPIGGDFAAIILILGICGAGISTAFPILLIAPWLICDFTGRPRDVRSPLFRISGFVGVMFCFGTYVMKQEPVSLMVFSQAFQACILPAVAIPIAVLINRRDVMGEHTARWPLNLGLLGAVIFSLMTTYFAIAEAAPAIASFIAGKS